MAGHTVGGTIWKLKKNTEEIVYAMDLHHRKERHLAPSVLFSSGSAPPILRPTVLVLGCRFTQPVPMKVRDAQFLETIVTTLQGGGDVLLPIDGACRWLELAYILDTAWYQQGYTYPIYCVSHVAEHVIRAAAGMLEWFSESLTQVFSTTRTSPFEWTSITFTQDVEFVLQQRGPKVMLASDIGMGMGPSWTLFSHLHTQPQHRIVLPFDVPSYTLAAQLKHLSTTPLPWTLPWTTTHLVQKMDVSISNSESPNIGTPTSPFSSSSSTIPTTMPKDIISSLEKSHLLQSIHPMNEESVEVEKMEEKDEEEEEEEDRISGSFHPHDHTWSGFQGHDAFVYTRPKVFPYTDLRRRWDDYGEFFQGHEELPWMKRDPMSVGFQGLQPSTSFPMEGGTQFPATSRSTLLVPSSSTHPTTSNPTPFKEMTPPVTDAVFFLDDPTELHQVMESKDLDFHVQCGVTDLDMNGLWDERSCLTIVGHLHAHQCILVSCSTNMATTLATGLPDLVFHVPEKGGKALNVSSAKDVVQVKLTDALTTSMDMQKYLGYELGWVHAYVHRDPSDTTVPPRLDILHGNPPSSSSSSSSSFSTTGLAMNLGSVPTTTTTMTTVPFHKQPPLVIGQLKLSEFKWVLDQQEGLHTQFREGVLVVNDKVGISKVSDGELRLEGKVCKEYYQVRDLLYKQHVMF
ncbi:hypothetical protein HMI55_004067 [Coelomomyces lativittatus]|nr:hypothetical protein HMI56_003936 [Coelomomyces lativittatus]KAJ1515075.1 hypothetical protein HMI55_004067 [Coelomomyces lativittatus]